MANQKSAVKATPSAMSGVSATSTLEEAKDFSEYYSLLANQMGEEEKRIAAAKGESKGRGLAEKGVASRGGGIATKNSGLSRASLGRGSLAAANKRGSLSKRGRVTR